MTERADIARSVQLILRPASVSRISGSWQQEDYDVFDGDRDVGRVYLVDAYGASRRGSGA
jgi:hypothetical protein